MLSSIDAAWEATWPVIWNGIEANLQIICASALTLRKFFRTTFPRLFDDDAAGGGTGTGTGTTTTEWRRNESLAVGLRTFVGQREPVGAATTAKPQRLPTLLRVADDLEATLVHVDSLESGHRCRRSESSHRGEAHDQSTGHLVIHYHDPKLISPASDCGSERTMLHTPTHPTRPT